MRRLKHFQEKSTDIVKQNSSEHVKRTEFQLPVLGKISLKKNSNLFGMETRIMKMETKSGMELMVFSNGSQKKHIKCMFVFFYQNTGVISNALHARVIA